MSGYLVVFGKLIITYRFFNDNTFPILKLINSLQYYGIFGIIKHRAEKLGVLSMEYIKVGFAFLTDGFGLTQYKVKSFALRQKVKSKARAYGEIVRFGHGEMRSTHPALSRISPAKRISHCEAIFRPPDRADFVENRYRRQGVSSEYITNKLYSQRQCFSVAFALFLWYNYI